MNTLNGRLRGLMHEKYHLDYATLHLDGGRSPYMNGISLSVECKYSKPIIFHSCTSHRSTILVPKGIKKARKA